MYNAEKHSKEVKHETTFIQSTTCPSQIFQTEGRTHTAGCRSSAIYFQIRICQLRGREKHPYIEQAIKLSELLNHDFLYAYTLSSRYMQGHPKPLQIVMEDNSYMTAIESNQSTADMLGNYRSLSDSDRQLIDTFVANLASKNSRL